MKKLFLLVLFSTCIALTHSVHAEDNQPGQSDADATDELTEEDVSGNTGDRKTYYTVEVILFRHLNTRDKNSEYWSRPEPDFIDANALENPDQSQPVPTFSEAGKFKPADLSTVDPEPALAVYDLSAGSFKALLGNIAALPADKLTMVSEATHIKRSRPFRLLAHFGWTQPALGKKSALPIAITHGNRSDVKLPEGELKLFVSRYLHLQVDLAEKECIAPAPTQTAPQTATQPETGGAMAQASRSESAFYQSSRCIENVYRFAQQRKMRSNELHYLDNPVFGLLVQVTRAK